MNDGMTMLVAFPDQSETFVLGFEAGMLWRRLEAEAEPLIDMGFDEGFPVHTANLEVISRMASSKGYAVETKPVDDCWSAVRLTFSGGKPKLSVVT